MPNFPGNDLRLLSLKGAKAASGRPFWPLWPHSFGLFGLGKGFSSRLPCCFVSWTEK